MTTLNIKNNDVEYDLEATIPPEQQNYYLLKRNLQRALVMDIIISPSKQKTLDFIALSSIIFIALSSIIFIAPSSRITRSSA